MAYARAAHWLLLCLINLYACGMAERWVDRVNNIYGVGTYVSYKLDKQLFRRSVRGACKMVFFKDDFADDVALHVGHYKRANDKHLQ